MRPVPTRDLEHAAIARGARVVAFVDEVGRGAAAGPVCVCALVPGPGPAPDGLADSKLLTPRARQRLVPRITAWVAAWAIGQASAAEIDEHGISTALRLAAIRALEQLPARPDLVVLDGPVDYIGAPWNVTPHVKADQREVAAAAASILAKEHRDARMRDLATDLPGYGLDRNAGYLSARHRAALVELGPTREHRTSWSYMDDLPQWAHLRRGPRPPWGPRADTGGVSTAARRHWLNTIVGILDGAFHLSEEEQYAVAGIVTQVLVALRVPERGTPAHLPVPVAQEAHGGYYSLALESPRQSGVVRPVRPVTTSDVVVSLEAWREALVGMFTTAYPDLTGEERVMLTKVFDDLLAAIGVPNRAAAFVPDTVAEALKELAG